MTAAGWWAAAVISGAAWGALNNAALFGLIREIMMRRGIMRVFFFAVFKFALLYGAGVFLLNARVLPVVGLLTGMTIALLGAGTLCLKRS